MILCDMDMVLATSGGTDTAVGHPIYRTFKDPPSELDLIRKDEIPFYIVTAKVENEARTILNAIGLEKYVTSVVGANSLVWPTLWRAIKNGRLPNSISKAFWRNVVQDTLARDKTKCIVMIEDRPENLLDMFEMGCIDVGILVPQIRLAGEFIVEWFDLGLALGLARNLVLGIEDKSLLSRHDLVVHQWHKSGLEAVDPMSLFMRSKQFRYLVKLPTVSVNGLHDQGIMLQSLETGCRLVADRRNVVSLLRACRRAYRRL